METLRDTISALVDKAEAPTEQTPVKTEPVEVETPVEETAEQKAGRTAGRARDEKGRLLPGPPKEEPVVAAPEVKKPPKPSSWKKDYEQDWEKLDPRVAEYINQRESDYAKGVSTYKTEWEQAKPLLEAVNPYLPDIQRLGITPAQAVAKLAQAHRDMSSANPMQKLQFFARMANDYQVPLQALLDPQFAQQWQQNQLQSQQPPQVPVEKLVEQKMSEYFSKQAVEAFGSDKEKYPHFEAVRSKMAQLLESGLANDLEGAYHAAVKLDDELWQAEQQAKLKAEEAQRLEAQAKAVKAAKGNAISPKSSTPSVPGAGAKKGLRDTLESAYEEVMSGRV